MNQICTKNRTLLLYVWRAKLRALLTHGKHFIYLHIFSAFLNNTHRLPNSVEERIWTSVQILQALIHPQWYAQASLSPNFHFSEQWSLWEDFHEDIHWFCSLTLQSSGEITFLFHYTFKWQASNRDPKVWLFHMSVPGSVWTTGTTENHK